MTLRQLLTTLTNSNVMVTIKDPANNVMVEIMAPGVASLEDAIEEREVKEWTIEMPLKMTVVLKAAE